MLRYQKTWGTPRKMNKSTDNLLRRRLGARTNLLVKIFLQFSSRAPEGDTNPVFFFFFFCFHHLCLP
ncbi:Uncharacterized protein APZ42_018124 [Daphnia magna]|uniref:Uncharacterized protein n=1 Tax=Daphnia magna TaxID=35525 RepID=A0A162CI86_9CRUS|nr:Uncharacterized protein APZ42_018124 [Daphnia magna]